MHPAIVIGTVRSLIVDVAMRQIPRSTERISNFLSNFQCWRALLQILAEKKSAGLCAGH